MNRQQQFLQIVSGEAHGHGTALLRAGLAVLEPFYGVAVRLRNLSFDRGWRRQAALGRPVVSVGNLTVGGTGKTPLVAWLCEKLREVGLPPAVLMRGYKARRGEQGDEERLLRALLGDSVPIAANPDRVAGAAAALATHPEVPVFVLDDGFQHRRVRRDVDLVLIDATRPFGYDRLLPRGLLREPVSALRRASAVILTRANLAPQQALEDIRGRIAQETATPVFSCNFIPDGFNDAAGGHLIALPGNRALPVCGIGNPKAFADDLQRQGIYLAGTMEFDDHHHYTGHDVMEIRRAAESAGAPVVTTMKDWVKLQPLWSASGTGEVFIARQGVSFATGDDQRLMQLVQAGLKQAP